MYVLKFRCFYFYRKSITLTIIEEDSYEKDALFYVELGEPQLQGGESELHKLSLYFNIWEANAVALFKSSIYLCTLKRIYIDTAFHKEKVYIAP